MMMLVLHILIPILVLIGLWQMSRVPTAVKGNELSVFAMTLAVTVTLLGGEFSSMLIVLLFLVIGGFIGLRMARKVQMIQMPQMVGLLNGLGGGASMLVGLLSLVGIKEVKVLASYLMKSGIGENEVFWVTPFEGATSVLAIVIGALTLSGSLVAAGKLHRVLPQKPVRLSGHSFYVYTSLLLCVAALALVLFFFRTNTMGWIALLSVVGGLAFGIFFTLRVGGADMPITISLLNSLSGVAGGIAGMAIGNLMLVAIGGIVGASGLLLTQIMCRAMNRSLVDILLGKTAAPAPAKKAPETNAPAVPVPAPEKPEPKDTNPLLEAKDVIIVPGYGMALAQAQQQVKQLADAFTRRGARVRYAIHPVAGRMPGHMNVLLAEANVDYDDLKEMDQINGDFKDADLVVVIGANDVLNPAAREAEGTPIYGMPVLNVDQAKHVIICNYDLNPGYAGVPNPLYDNTEKVTMMLGDAKESLQKLISELARGEKETASETEAPSVPQTSPLSTAKDVIIVPGYGMALAQAQQQVKQLADAFTRRGARVRYAIHPVAGRMPGHMNVLLAEANVDYDDLKEMDQINGDFKDADLVVVIGANDVLNPAAREAEGTPIYGMPVLNVDQAKHVIICNYDLNPGYAGVPNPLYDNTEKVTMMLGDAKESLQKLISELA